jgi:hypothetical protein
VQDSSHRSATSRDGSECNNWRVADLLGELLSVRVDRHADALCRECQAWLPLNDVDDAVEDGDEPDE